MSLRLLNKRIRSCSREMEKQRRCALILLDRQKDDIRQQVRRVPLPVAIGLGFVGGFLVERLVRFPAPSRIFRLVRRRLPL